MAIKIVTFEITKKEFIQIYYVGLRCTLTSSVKGGGKYGAAIDGVKSLLLSLASERIDLDTPQIKNAVQSAINAIANEYT